MQAFTKAILGNAVTREIDLGREIGTAGLWKIREGKKKSTQKEVSVFVS